MKQVAVTISGKRYEMKLDDRFADFVQEDLADAGLFFDRDNKPDALLRAYLRLAKQATSYENEIDLLIDTLEGL